MSFLRNVTQLYRTRRDPEYMRAYFLLHGNSTEWVPGDPYQVRDEPNLKSLYQATFPKFIEVFRKRRPVSRKIFLY